MSWLEEARARATLRPFPVAPLARVLGLGVGDTAALALRLGLHRGTVGRYRSLGLTVDQADEWACRVDLNPGEIWEHWWTGLRGVALVHAGKETCAQGHPLDRRDGRGDRCCTPCPRAAGKRYRERKSLVAAPMAPTGQHRAPLVLLGGGMAQSHGTRERLVTLLPPDLSQWIDREATAAGLSRSAWACMKLAELRTAEADQQVAS